MPIESDTQIEGVEIVIKSDADANNHSDSSLSTTSIDEKSTTTLRAPSARISERSAMRTIATTPSAITPTTSSQALPAVETPGYSTPAVLKKRTPLPSGKPRPAPVAAKGTTFKWEHNLAIASNPFKVNEPQPLSLKLVDITGEDLTYIYSKQSIDWTAKEAVVKANNWANQIIARKLNQPNPNESRATRYRPQWTKQEKHYLEDLIMKQMKKLQRKPTGEDWKTTAEFQNARFAGKTIKVGQAFALNSDNRHSSQMSQLCTKEFTVPRRTGLALQVVVRKWPDTRKMMTEILDEVLDKYLADHSKESGDKDADEPAKNTATAEDQ